MAFTTTLSTACLSRSRSTRTSTPSTCCSTADADFGGLRLRPRQFDDFVHEFLQRDGGQIQFHGPGEIEERLDHAIEAQDFAGDDFHLRLDIGIAARELGLGHFHVQQDGVERILDLVRHAAGDAADGGQAVGGLQFATEFALRFGVAQPHQQSGAGIGRRPAASPADPPRAARPPRPERRLARRRPAERADCESGGRSATPARSAVRAWWRAERRRRWTWSERSLALLAEELLDRARREHQAALAIEDEDGVFEILQQAVDVAAQVGDFELRAAQPLARAC